MRVGPESCLGKGRRQADAPITKNRHPNAHYPPITAAISRAVSLGVLPTWTPTASSASCLAAAVPAEPDTIAPACPIVLPSGAVKPAMYPTTGLVTCSAM